jgi:hypothetical protein
MTIRRKVITLQGYFNELFTDVNTPFRFVPRPLTAAIIASAMPAAIKPYSIAVAPVSSVRNSIIVRFKACLLTGMSR